MTHQAFTDDHRVRIERLKATYLVPSAHPRPESVRLRLDRVLRDSVPALCARMLEQAFAPDDPGMWLISRLDVELALDVGVVDDAHLIRAWSERMASAIARTVLRGADGENVLYFRDRATYVAQFAYDLARGDVWTRWHYTAFDGLQHLSPSAALREALTREPGLTLSVLDELAGTGRLACVLDALNVDDAQRVYAVSLASNGAMAARSERELINLLLDVWDDAFTPVHSPRALPHQALQLLLTSRARNSRAARDGRIGAVIEHLFGFAALLDAVGRDASFQSLLRAGDVRDSSEHLLFFHQRAAGDNVWLENLAQRLTSKRNLTRSSNLAASSTLFGGLFLLFPALVESRVAHMIAAAPYADAKGLPTTDALRYLVACKCMGGARASQFIADSVVAMALGFKRAPSAEEIDAWGDLTNDVQHRELMRSLLDAMAERGQASGRWLCVECVQGAWDGCVLLLRDLEFDAWLYAESVTDDIADSLKRALDAVQSACGLAPHLLVVGVDTSNKLLEIVRANTAMAFASSQQHDGVEQIELGSSRDGEPLKVWTNNRAAFDDETRGVLKNDLARQRPRRDEFDYFTLSDSSAHVISSTGLDLALTLAARAVMRTFTRGLMGFQHSSPRYLYENFLAGAATVCATGKALQVELAPRPLQMVLNLASFAGRVFSVPWLALPVQLEFQKQS